MSNMFVGVLLLAGLLVSSARADYAARVRGYIAGLNRDPESALAEGRADVFVTGKDSGYIGYWDEAYFGVPKPTDSILPDKKKADVNIAAQKDAKRQEALKARQEALKARQEAKTPREKARENKVIDFLCSEGVLTNGSFTVTIEKLEAMFDAWDQLPGDLGDAKAAKYERLMRPLRLRGLSDTEVVYHPEVKTP